MIEISLKGHLKLTEQLRYLQLTAADKRRVHGWLAREMVSKLKQAVRAQVLASPLELFEGSDKVRRGKARSFAGMVGRRVEAERLMIYDMGHGHKGLRRPAEGDKATQEQALLLLRLGYRHGTVQQRVLTPRQIMRTLGRKQAGIAVRKLAEKLPEAERRQLLGLRLRKQRGGSLLLMVWRRQGQEILAAVDPLEVFRRFMSAKLTGAA